MDMVGMVGSPLQYNPYDGSSMQSAWQTGTPRTFMDQYGKDAYYNMLNQQRTAQRTTTTHPSVTGQQPAAPGAPAANPMSGPAPLTGAVQQGFGMGLSGFNPQWYDKLGENLWGQASKNFLENINPALDSSAIMAGGYGGDRAALAKGTAAGRVSDSVTNALAPLYHQGYESSLNRGLQTGQSALQGLLGLGQLDISRYGQDINAYNAQTNAASQAAAAAGTPMFTNPWAAALGGGLGVAQLLALLNQG